MPVRPRVPRITLPIDPLEIFTLACDDSFTATFFGPGFRSQADARRWWPRYRRTLWEATPRMRIPRPAEIFDGLSFASLAALRWQWGHVRFALDPVVEALARDRASVKTFEARDPAAARQIADVLARLRQDLDEVERRARALALPGCPHWQRASPWHNWPGGTYGRGADPQDDAA